MRALNNLIAATLGLCIAHAVTAQPIEQVANHLARQIASSFKPGGTIKIAVLNFKDTYDNDLPLGRWVSDELTAQLFRQGKKQFQIVEREKIDDIIKELKLESTGLVDEGAAQKVGMLADADALLTGTVATFGKGQLRIIARLIAVPSGKILATADASMDSTSANSIHRGPAHSIRRPYGRAMKCDAYLSRELEVDTAKDDEPQYRSIETWAGSIFDKGIMLATAVDSSPSIVSYQIPANARAFSATVAPRKETCDTSGGGVNGWRITIKTTAGTKICRDFQYYTGDVPVNVRVDDIPKGERRILSIDLNPMGQRTCDRAVIGNAHFTCKNLAVPVHVNSNGWHECK